MKKVLFILITALIVLSLSVGVSAAEISQTETLDKTNHERPVYVTYEILQETYKITIPKEVPFTAENTELTTTISATDIILTEGNFLNVSVTSEHGWKLTEHENVNGVDKPVPNGNIIAYTMSYSEDSGNTYIPITTQEKERFILMHIPSGISSDSLPVKFEMGTVLHTGDYKDKLTFNSWVHQP